MPTNTQVAGVTIDPDEYYSIQLGKYVPDYKGLGEMTKLHRYQVKGQVVLDLADSIVDVTHDPPEHPETLETERPAGYIPRTGRTEEQSKIIAAEAASTFHMTAHSPAPGLTPVPGVRKRVRP